MNYEIFVICLFVVALLYSSVGHGGASGYLALMALAGINPEVMKSSALVLNLFVAGIAFVSFRKAGFFNTRLLLIVIIGSIPAAFFGAQLIIDPAIYKIILGICLIIAVARIMFKPKEDYTVIKSPPVYILILIGISIGFISGMIGIGGGILLSPILILFRWASIKESAGISAAFIFLNSFSGLTALVGNGFLPDASIALWIVAALLGGICGSFLGSIKFSIRGLKYVLVNVLVVAAIKLMIF